MDGMDNFLIAIYIFFMAYAAFKESTLVLIDAVKNPELQHEMTQHVEGKFKVRGKILLGPLGQNFSK
jgi:divalent metal cation (Fe/Co/Zn/Cd) transporter